MLWEDSRNVPVSLVDNKWQQILGNFGVIEGEGDADLHLDVMWQNDLNAQTHYKDLPKSEEVQVRCYNLENIKAIRLLGERWVSDGRSILRINA